MIKFMIDADKQQLHFECSGDPTTLVVDAITCLRKTYDAVKAVSEERAEDMRLFIFSQLIDNKSAFFEDVDWPAEGWEDPGC